MKTLLEQALDIPSSSKQGNITDEDIELVTAYFNGQVNSNQVRKLKNKGGVQFYSYVVLTLRYAFSKGKIIFK